MDLINSMVNRREALSLVGVAAFAVTAGAKPEAAANRASGPFVLPPLPFNEDALAPTISSTTVNVHYGKHHKAYVDTLNRLVAGTPYETMELDEVVIAAGKGDTAIFNQAGQAWNHIFYWEQFKPGGQNAPRGPLADAIDETFGDQSKLTAALATAAARLFGSGWVWLVVNDGKLRIEATENAGSPLVGTRRPLIGIDVWEHAYYLDYHNRRSDHVAALMERILNWSIVSERFTA